MKKTERISNLMPNGVPRYVRCYDNGGKTFDRYTVVFTGHYTHKTRRQHWYLGMSSNPFHPQGVGNSGESNTQIDTPKYSHLGKKIAFESLLSDVQEMILMQGKEERSRRLINYVKILIGKLGKGIKFLPESELNAIWNDCNK